MRRIELFAAEIQQAAERAAGNVATDVHRAARCLQGNRELRGIERILDRRELVHVRAEHERLAAADEHVDGAAVLHHGVHGDLLRELVEQAVALIEQVVRRLPAGAGDARRNLVVQARDALRDAS